jgi:lysophospholipase L1-like esterase
MLGARSDLKDLGFVVDATESRQSYSAPALLRKRSGSLPENVIVHLGTNGTFPLSTCKSIVRAAGSERRVFLVTVSVPRSWERANNATIRRCASAFADGRVHVVDWHNAAADHRSWLYSDRIHLKPAGAAAFARMLDSAVDTAEQEERAQALAQASGSGVAGIED